VPAWERVLNLSHEKLWAEQPIDPEVIVEMDFVLGSRILQEVNEIAPYTANSAERSPAHRRVSVDINRR
jgi:hypothetical protein